MSEDRSERQRARTGANESDERSREEPVTGMSEDRSERQRHGFQYVVLRCVPRVDREEFVNVGVLLYSQSADYLCAGSKVQQDRLKALAPDLDLDAVRSALAAIEAVCCGRADPATRAGISLGQRFGWLAAPRSTVVQPGPIHGGLTEDPARQLQHLMDTLLG
jgi:hypothetical protein